MDEARASLVKCGEGRCLRCGWAGLIGFSIYFHKIGGAFICCALTLVVIGSSPRAEGLPTTAEFMSLINACAAGSKVKYSAELLGSIERLFTNGGEESRGRAELETSAAFLSLLPENQRLEGYRLYVECIQGMIKTRSVDPVDERMEFLRDVGYETPLSKFSQVMGEPIKVKNLYGDDGEYYTNDSGEVKIRWYQYESINVFVVSANEGFLDAVAVQSDLSESRIFLPYMGLSIASDQGSRDFRIATDFHLRDMFDLCEMNEVISAHARFSYVKSKDCYFGAPGGYMRYQFIFQPTHEALSDCPDLDLEMLERGVSSGGILCGSFLNIEPNMTIVKFNDSIARLDFLIDEIYEWRYNFAQ